MLVARALQRGGQVQEIVAADLEAAAADGDRRGGDAVERASKGLLVAVGCYSAIAGVIAGGRRGRGGGGRGLSMPMEASRQNHSSASAPRLTGAASVAATLPVAAAAGAVTVTDQTECQQDDSISSVPHCSPVPTHLAPAATLAAPLLAAGAAAAAATPATAALI